MAVLDCHTIALATVAEHSHLPTLTPPAPCPTLLLEPHAARVTEAIQRARLTARFPLASTHVCEPMDEWSKCSNGAEMPHARWFVASRSLSPSLT